MSFIGPNPNQRDGSCSPKKRIVSSSVQQEVPNTPKKPHVINAFPFMKVPVVLGETTVQIDLDSTIVFPEPVLEIKQIKKNLKIVQCRLLLPTNKLFLKGFIRKNIQYATPVAGDHDFVTSNIHSLTIDVPFQVVTRLDFLGRPDFKSNPQTSEFKFFNSVPLPQGFPSKENLLSGDFSEHNQISEEVFNELPFCELLSSKIIEYDEALNRKMGNVRGDSGQMINAPFEEGTFTEVEEKMVIEITLKVLQNQQVHMRAPEMNTKKDEHEYNFDNDCFFN
ncbi:CsxC family protein [Neobacillus sp. PS3-40]|uniref:CsxC family protein n=1 Tax=Neobacillus sp. PS3-40 TaxID=3070679 RepID=UPI0027E04525|nr:DUF3794 domain-containing protein [Neobacillus sp. PS3-40]WML45237.1 DUF3794 domain-containing protein [Neobacillus sp. PS3-40]